MNGSWGCVPAAALAIWIAGCDAGDRAGRGGPIIRDSAGVRIVENHAAAWGDEEVWRLAGHPDLRIGVVEGDPRYQFSHIESAWRFGDGRVAVADGGTRELRFYDATGRFLSSSGGEGEGPGEFRSIDRMDVVNDSLWIYDSGLQRISVFTWDGRFTRSFGLPSLNESLPQPIGLFADGSLLVNAAMPFWQGELATGIQQIRAAYFRLSPTGEVLDSLGEFTDGQHFVRVEGERVLSIGLPFARRSAVIVGEEGFYFGTSETYEIMRYSPEGRLEQLIRRTYDNLPVTDEDLRSFIRERQQYASGENTRRRMEAMFRELPLPVTMPAYSDMRLDTEGNLWVEEYRRPGEVRSRWTIFNAEGWLLGTIDLPSGFTPIHIGGDFVLGRQVDELDVQSVALYRLVKPES